MKNRNAKFFFAVLLAMTMAFQAVAQTAQPQTQAQQQSAPGVTQTVRRFPLIPPMFGEKTRFTNGQIIVAAQQIYETAFNSDFESAFGAATTRKQQEDAIAKFASPDLLKVLTAGNTTLAEPEQYQPVKDQNTALNMAAIKQPFVPFTQWGVNPFGKEVTSWQGLCSTYSETMQAVIERTTYSPDVKAEWVDALADACKNGLDGRYKKVVQLIDWPLWQWTTGRTAGTVREGRTPGVNVAYADGPAQALYLLLRKSGMVVLHGFKCRGNPIVPFTIANFQVTKELAQPPRCVRLYSPDTALNTLKMGQSARFIVQLDNPSEVPFSYRYIFTNKVSGIMETVSQDRPDVTLQFNQAGDFRLNVTGAFDGQPIDTANCAVDLTIEAPPTPPVVVTPPSTTVTTRVPSPSRAPEPHKAKCGTLCKVLIVAAVGALGGGAAIALGGKKTPPPVGIKTGQKPGDGQ